LDRNLHHFVAIGKIKNPFAQPVDGPNNLDVESQKDKTEGYGQGDKGDPGDGAVERPAGIMQILFRHQRVNPEIIVKTPAAELEFPGRQLQMLACGF